jgi:branched-chain amino acid transport system substrate-binding protein
MATRQNKLLVFSLMVVFIMTLTTLVVPGSAQKPIGGEPIKIGLVTCFTGPAADTGIATRDGALLAIKEINAAGGVLGRPLELVARDDKRTPAVSTSVTVELCTTQGIKFAIGPTNSSSARADAPIFCRYKVPTLLDGSMADELLEGCSYYYRITNNNTVSGSAMLSIIKQRQWKRPAVVYVNDFFGQTMFKFMQEAFSQMGLEVVAVASHDFGEPDMTPQARKLFAGNPDVIVLLNYLVDTANVLRTTKALGYKGDYVNYSIGWRNSIREIAGKDSNGLIFPAGQADQGFYAWYRPGYAAFRIKLDAELGQGIFPNCNAPKEPLAESGYHCIHVIKQGIMAAGSTDPDKYMQALMGRQFRTVLGDVSFPNAPKSWEGITDPKALFIRQYVNGHLRVWSEDPRCIETFESTRIQAEEETYKAGGDYKRGVTIKQFFKRWQNLLKENQTKIQSEIETKKARLNITPEMADIYQKAIKEILAMKF